MKSTHKIFSNSGFSLVEILVVISSIVILSGFGFATLVVTQRRQVVDQAALNIQQMIQKAKFNTISRVSTKGLCSTTSFSSYQLSFTQNSVSMNAICKDLSGNIMETPTIERKTFPSQVVIGVNGCTKFAFEVLTNQIKCTGGSTVLPSAITVSAYGNQKRLDIDTSGNVSITTVAVAMTLPERIGSLLGL